MSIISHGLNIQALCTTWFRANACYAEPHREIRARKCAIRARVGSVRGRVKVKAAGATPSPGSTPNPNHVYSPKQTLSDPDPLCDPHRTLTLTLVPALALTFTLSLAEESLSHRSCPS